MPSSSVKVSWWAEQIGAVELSELQGIKDFQQSLDDEYIAVVRPRPGDLGGLYQMAVQFVSNITLADVTAFIASGMAYDMLKHGSKSFVLRPFLDAYKELRDKNQSIGIEGLVLEFKDSIIAIDGSYPDAIHSQIGFVLQTLAVNYKGLALDSGEMPFEIRIPVFEDTAEDRPARFRALLEVDETVAKGRSDDYSEYWGLWYDYSRQYRVFDVKRRLLIDESFISRARYWEIMEERWSKHSGPKR